MLELFNEIGVHIPEILLPAKDTDLTRWSVVACDQYTSQPDYWQRVDEEVGDHPSTLRLIFPEIYLKDDDCEERISRINDAMNEYIEKGLLELQKPGFVMVDRSTPHTPSRKGLVLAVDLEFYDYREGSKSLIRATEGTVLDRIPPRIKIRENAPMELPHIMLLIDDPGKTVIEPLFDRLNRYDVLYDFDLMLGGGHIRGWKVEDKVSLNLLAEALIKLADPKTFAQKYGLPAPLTQIGGVPDGLNDRRATGNNTVRSAVAEGVLLFAAGDGNHSLATAKTHWENVKARMMKKYPDPNKACFNPDHPARYALVEVVNLHDEGLVFEPIHRVLTGVDPSGILDDMKNAFAECSKGRSNMEYTFYESRDAMEKALSTAKLHNTASASIDMEPSSSGGVCVLPFILEGRFGLITVHNPPHRLEAGTLQSIMDLLMERAQGMEVDYVHGEEVVVRIGNDRNGMGFFLPVMDKQDLFRTVILDGALPKKTFSMGEAEEKRYYLECRRIKQG